MDLVQRERDAEIRRLVLLRDPGGGVVEIGVRDNGPGLSPEVAERLFEPFLTTKEKGMGVGLSICRAIVESHGGRLWASPNADRGVTFSFTLGAGDPA